MSNRNLQNRLLVHSNSLGRWDAGRGWERRCTAVSQAVTRVGVCGEIIRILQSSRFMRAGSGSGCVCVAADAALNSQ